MISTWDELIKSESTKDYWIKLQNRITEDEKAYRVFPPQDKRFTFLELTPLDEVKIVIIGQDPYHGIGQAHGLAFSVNKGIAIPKSLQNIFIELKNDLGILTPNHGDLSEWAKRGVLLMNACLTVREKEPLSHVNFGWETFTDAMIRILNEQNRPIVFILWGNYARAKKKLLTNKNHLIIESVHPSPLSAHRGFFGSKPFSKANAFLQDHKIDWKIKS